MYLYIYIRIKNGLIFCESLEKGAANEYPASLFDFYRLYMHIIYMYYNPPPLIKMIYLYKQHMNFKTYCFKE